MSKVIQFKPAVVDMWDDKAKLAEIRKMVSPNCDLTELEFSFLIQLGKATQLNPFMKEIWVVKYRKRNRDTGKFEELPAQIFIGRDGYRKAAQRQADYEYHQVNAVYTKDQFNIINDEIHHAYGFGNRGELMGAYCIVKRKKASRPTYVMVSMDEYNLRQSLWEAKPETMIKKVAEAQALRQAFQEVLSGTYSDAEMPEEPVVEEYRVVQGNTQTQKLKSLLNVTAAESASPDQIESIKILIDETDLPSERLEKALEHYKVNAFNEMNTIQAATFIRQLQREREKCRA